MPSASSNRLVSTFLACATGVAMLALGAHAAAEPDDAGGAVLLFGGTLVDGRGGPPVPDTTILVEDGRIREIWPLLALPGETRAAKVVDVRGRYVIPGLVDVGVRLRQPGACAPGVGESAAQTIRNARAALAGGVTSVLEVGTDPSHARALAEWLADEPGRGPRVHAASPVLAAPGAYPFARSVSDATGIRRVSGQEVRFVGTGPTAAATAVEALEGGARVVQVSVTDRAFDLTPFVEMPLTTLRSIRTAAHAAGGRVLAYSNSAASWRTALRGGADAIAIASLDPLARSLVREIHEQGVVVVPSLALVHAPLVGGSGALRPDAAWRSRVPEDVLGDLARFASDWGRRPEVRLGGIVAPKDVLGEGLRAAVANLKRLRAAGVRVAIAGGAGSCYVPHGAPLHEMRLLEDAGFERPEILTAATLHAAAVLGLEDEIGTIEVGKRADLTVLRESPYRSLDAYRSVDRVVVDGHVVEIGAAEPSWWDRMTLAWAMLRAGMA